MLGFAWLTFRQAQEALKNGQLQEAYRLLCQPRLRGHRRSWELLRRIARGFADQGDRHLRHGDALAAWKDLLAAEQVGAKDSAIAGLRRDLTRRCLADVRALMVAGEPGRAAELVAKLRKCSVGQPELQLLDEAAKNWLLAREQASRGEFALALEAMQRVRQLPSGPREALEQFVRVLERRRQIFSALLVQLHDAAEQKDWREVVRLSEQVLGLAPHHVEARKVRARAWRVIEPETVASMPRPLEKTESQPVEQSSGERFLLWIDGVGGFLVCLGNRVTIGQATPDGDADIPLYADVSRLHGALTRDAEGYLLEAVRPLQVNGQPVEKALLQSGDNVRLGSSCQLLFRQPVPVSASARLDLASGHRLPLALDGVLLMADTLVLGPGAQAHVTMPDVQQAIVLYRQKEGLGIRYPGSLCVDGQACQERGQLRPNSTVTGDDFAFAIEPVGTGLGRT